jgi:Ni,Fe-hydrogenase maturation factor
MKKVVLYFGNELIPSDRLAIDVVKNLEEEMKETEFFHCKSPEDLTKFESVKNLFLLDVSPNVSNVQLITDLNLLKERKMLSLHDFDLNFFFQMMLKLGKIKSIKIILIPRNGNIEEITKKVKNILSNKMFHKILSSKK